MPVEIVMTKAAAAIGGLLGGLAMFAFMRPHTIMDATVRGGICTGTAIIFSPILIEYFDAVSNMEHLVAAGTILGFLSWGVLSMVARFFIKAEAANKDIVEAAREIKN